MIGISIAARIEWESTLEYYSVQESELVEYPFGKYFFRKIDNKELIFYYTGSRKVSSAAANQYMIIKYNLEKIIVAGSCAGIDQKYNKLDIIIPNIAHQYDCSIREIELLIKEKYSVEIDLSSLNFDFKTGSIGTADRAIILWEDYLVLKDNGLTVVDEEAAAIAYVCKKNNVKCIIVKGISDFPKDVMYDVNNELNNEQYAEFISNVPRIMKRIFDDYLDKLI